MFGRRSVCCLLRCARMGGCRAATALVASAALRIRPACSVPRLACPGRVGLESLEGGLHEGLSMGGSLSYGLKRSGVVAPGTGARLLQQHAASTENLLINRQIRSAFGFAREQNREKRRSMETPSPADLKNDLPKQILRSNRVSSNDDASLRRRIAPGVGLCCLAHDPRLTLSHPWMSDQNDSDDSIVRPPASESRRAMRT